MTAPREYPKRVDVAIVGAGIVGGACFHEIARERGLTVACFEAAHKLYGSTARSAATFRHQFSAEVNVRMSLLAGLRYGRFPEEMGAPPVIRRNGYLFIYRDAAALDAAAERARFQTSLGVPDVEVLGAAETLRRVPELAPDGLAGATFCRHDGFVLPDLITSTYFERGKELGGLLFQWSPVTAIRTGADGAVRAIVVRGEHEIETRAVVNCAGPWANKIARLAGVEVPVVPVKRYLYFTSQLDPKRRDVRGFPLLVFDLEAYCRPEANGLMLGWDRRPEKPAGWDRFPPPPVDFAHLTDDIEPGFGLEIDGYGYEVLAEIAEDLPFVAEEVGLEAVTCGYYEVTPDEKAIVDEDPRVRGLFHAAGFSGHGVMHAPATGAVVRDLVLGASPPFDVRGLRLEPLLRNEAREDPEQLVI